MSKVLTFSRTFPAYHPKAGQPTNFLESIVNSGVIQCPEFDTGSEIDLLKLNPNLKWQDVFEYAKTWNTTIAAFGNGKHHTIRSGHRFKAGDWFSPRVWSGKPYQSKQIIIAPDIQVKKVWDIEFNCRGGLSFQEVLINGKIFAQLHNGYDNDKNSQGFASLSANDGLTVDDAIDWFFYRLTPDYFTGDTQKQGKRFTGQIICWNESINY